MKKKSNLIWGALLEGLGELLITLVFLMIGTVIVGVFLGEPTAEKTDPYTLTFIGIVVFFIIFGSLACAIYAVVRFFVKKIKKRNKKHIDNSVAPEATENKADRE